MRGLTFLGLILWASCAVAQPADGSVAERAGAAGPKTPAVAAASEVATPAADANRQEATVDVAKTAPAAIEVAGTGDAVYKLKITELEGRVNELKEKIFRSKTRLAILKGTVLSSSIAGAEYRIIHRNEMGSSFRLEKVTYSLDGTPIRSLVDEDGSLDSQREIEILNGPITPGNHTVAVAMVYRGNGFGIFSYLRGYVFNLRSSHTFHAEEGKAILVRVVGYEKGGMTTDLKDRPDIRFENQLSDVRRRSRSAAMGPQNGR